MRRSERAFLYGGLTVAILLAASSRFPALWGAPAVAQPAANAPMTAPASQAMPPGQPMAPSAAPTPAVSAPLPPSTPAGAPSKIASCDIYRLADRLMTSDRFKEGMNAERDRLGQRLDPMGKELAALQDRLQGTPPEKQQDQEIKDLVAEFTRKQGQFRQANTQAQTEFESYVAKKYVESYDAVRDAVDAVAARLGYTHVIASRSRTETIPADSVQRVIEAVLARPVITAPGGSDLTSEVMKELKLDENPPAPSAPAMGNPSGPGGAAGDPATGEAGRGTPQPVSQPTPR